MIEAKIRYIDDAYGVCIGDFTPDQILSLRVALMAGIKVTSWIKVEGKHPDPRQFDYARYESDSFVIDDDGQFYFEIIVK